MSSSVARRSASCTPRSTSRATTASTPARRAAATISSGGRARGGGGHRNGRVVALVGAVQRQEHLVVAGARGAEVDDPTADGDQVLLARELLASPPHRSLRRGLEDGSQIRVRLPENEHAAGLDDP